VHREHTRWYSPSLGRDMDMLIHGHGGARVLVFPTSQGRFFEWEDRGMTRALDEHLERGWLQLFCVDSVDAESWYNKRMHPGARAWRHLQYDAYLEHEVIPFTQSRNGTPFMITTGSSFGAYHAMAFAFRHPFLVQRMLGMSGVYDIREMTDGYSDENVYFCNPPQFIPNEHDPWRLDALRRMDIILATGKDDSYRWNNEQMSTLLWQKGIGNALRLWDGWAHDWPWWERMAQTYVGGHD
jgi:esterase/lipase superfamily enzyme